MPATTIVLRVDGENVPDCEREAWVPPELIDRVWRRGDPRLGARAETTSGFSLCLADGGMATAAAVERATRILQELRDGVVELVAAGATAVVDLAVYVASDAPCSVAFPTAFMRAVVDCGASLEVSAYPTHDDPVRASP